MEPGLHSNTTPEERVSTLQSFGLTENQAKAYLALLELGRATASALNKLSGVPRNKVYSVVEELNEKGLVEIVLEDPIVFEARPVTRYLDLLASELESKRRDLKASMPRLADEFQIKATLSEDDLQGGSFRIYKGRRAVLQQHSRMNRDAKGSVKVVCTPSTPARMLASDMLGDYPDLEAVRFEIFTPLTKKNIPAVKSLFERLGRAIRVTTGSPRNVIIKLVDDKQVFFTHVIPDTESTTQGDDVGVWTDNPVFLQLATELIERAKERSQEFHTARLALEADQPFPEMRVLQDPTEHRELLMLGLMQAKEIMAVTDGSMLLRGMASMADPSFRANMEQREVRIRLVTRVTQEILKAVTDRPNIELRHLDSVPGNFIVFGDRVIRTHRMDPGAEDPFEVGSLTFYSTLPGVVVEAKDHFERLWQAAVPTGELDPAELPKASRPDRDKGTPEEEAVA
ncbi:MAG: hypothetical protein KY455_05135 [Euryarchaeota archaeon]|nr:hypothetical protein [Euryarchaeota archaeon]